MSATDPASNCALCPRLADFRDENRQHHPEFHNAPVASFGPRGAALLIVGLAPGLKGANQTGRPFTGDFAGDLLYATLLEFGLAAGRYGRHAGDGLRLIDCRITNAVRCVPPENKPTPKEIATCRHFLEGELAGPPPPRLVLALGTIAHASVLKAKGLGASQLPFRHGALHDLPDGSVLADSYHCSRYNTNTGRLTPEMFQAVFDAALARLRA